jgi:uncharacterized protein (DUF433 family)
MNAQARAPWKYLAPKPGSAYKQLFVKGTRIMARILYGMHVNEEEPRSVEQIAAAFVLPVEAVQEAIAYCASNPPEIQEDWDREEGHVRARLSQAQTSIEPLPPLPSQHVAGA